MAYCFAALGDVHRSWLTAKFGGYLPEAIAKKFFLINRINYLFRKGNIVKPYIR